MTESNSMLTRVPLETTPLKPVQNVIDRETDSDDGKDEYHADASEVQEHKHRPRRGVPRLDYAELNEKGKKQMKRKEKKK